MYTRRPALRPSFLLSGATFLIGLLGGVFGGRGGSVLANHGAASYEGPRGPRPEPKSYIRGSRFPQRQIVTNKMRCDARNHPKGKIYSDFDLRWLAKAQAKRDRRNPYLPLRGSYGGRYVCSVCCPA